MGPHSPLSRRGDSHSIIEPFILPHVRQEVVYGNSSVPVTLLRRISVALTLMRHISVAATLLRHISIDVTISHCISVAMKL